MKVCLKFTQRFMETRGKSCSYHEWWTAPLKCTLNTYPLSVCWRFMFLNLKSGIYNEHSWTQTYTQHPPLITALTVCSVCIKSAFIVFFSVPPEKQVYGSIKLETGRSLEHRAGKKKKIPHTSINIRILRKLEHFSVRCRPQVLIFSVIIWGRC